MTLAHQNTCGRTFNTCCDYVSAFPPFKVVRTFSNVLYPIMSKVPVFFLLRCHAFETLSQFFSWAARSSNTFKLDKTPYRALPKASPFFPHLFCSIFFSTWRFAFQLPAHSTAYGRAVHIQGHMHHPTSSCKEPQ